MVITVHIPVRSIVDEVKTSRDYEAFMSEFAKGYLNVEIMEKEELIKEYSEEYQNLDDKDSFKGQYLDSWIYVLKEDIKSKKKFFR